VGGAEFQSPTKWTLKSTDFVDTVISDVLCDLCFSLNQPVVSADDKYVGILKHIIKSCEYIVLFLVQLLFNFFVT
jgi:hypothetical protein